MEGLCPQSPPPLRLRKCRVSLPTRAPPYIWYVATVLKTRTMSHTIDGAQTLCREIFCYYDLDLHMQWHSLHEDDVRTCSTTSPADESGIADPFPTGTRVEVWWPGDSCYYRATVLTTRTSAALRSPSSHASRWRLRRSSHR